MTSSPSGASPSWPPPIETIEGALARCDLLTFAQFTFPRYRAARHHHLIAAKLEAVERGEIDRLIITMPPRHGKTELASVRFPAWYLGRHPDRRVIGTSYAAPLAYRISRQVRNIVAGSRWPFPERLATDLAQVAAWDLAGPGDGSPAGGYIAAGVGGPITGQGAHLLLIDDPIKNQEEAESDAYREALWEWYTTTAYTRLEDRAAIIVIQTRWHHDDLAGRLLAAMPEGGDRWDVLDLPALADPTEAHPDPLGRAPGEALWPEKYDAAALARIQRAVGARAFAALYQARPSNDDTALFKRGWWRHYDAPPARFDQLIQSWDLAFKDTAGADFVVGQVWGAVGAERYLLDQVRGRLNFPATLDAVRALTKRWPRATLKLVEDKANGPAVIDTLTREIAGLVAVNPEGGKLARASAVSPQVEAGNVYLPDPRFTAWVQAFIEECAAFPNGAHDDQVDAMSQALLRLAAGRPFAPAVGGQRPDYGADMR